MIQIASTPLLKLTLKAYTSHITRLEIQIRVKKSTEIIQDVVKMPALQKELDDSLEMLAVLKNEIQKNEDDDRRIQMHEMQAYSPGYLQR